ncbi:MAG: hypothetical protein ACTSUO_07875 [Candidatus Thorarchaeota archaeon]
MGVRERRREKEREKVVSEPEVEETNDNPETMAETSSETHRPDVMIKTSESVEVVDDKEETVTAELSADVEETSAVMPQWGDIHQSEWMYKIPPRKEDQNLWAEEWGDFLLEWTEAKDVHIISITTFIKELPFSDLSGKVDAFKMIGDHLTQKDIANWLNKNKRQLRVFWRPLEDWADIIYQWSLETGHIRLDVKSIIIQEKDKAFASLPENDLQIVLEFMVDKEYAEWVDKKKYAIKVIV